MTSETDGKPYWLTFSQRSQLNGLEQFVVRIPPARFLGLLEGFLRIEEVPAGWWGGWVSQRATESL